jgi:hypothetical protein
MEAGGPDASEDREEEALQLSGNEDEALDLDATAPAKAVKQSYLC